MSKTTNQKAKINKLEQQKSILRLMAREMNKKAKISKSKSQKQQIKENGGVRNG